MDSRLINIELFFFSLSVENSDTRKKDAYDPKSYETGYNYEKDYYSQVNRLFLYERVCTFDTVCRRGI